jgi:dihydrofolate synthase/folylpolyglutamate synthase
MKNLSSDFILNRMMALHPKVIDLTLDRVWCLLDSLGNPQNNLPKVIHIAGTNGKGSTLSMLRAGLNEIGLKTHAYTSPHLVRFHERIQLGNNFIDENDLTEILDECYSANKDRPITYFEITTCAAILAMSRKHADYVLLEVGLGGRLDATNVVTSPTLTIITPVSVDHEQFLGNTIKKIAVEKAGIIKPFCPIIVGKQDKDALKVITEKALEQKAPILAEGNQWHVKEAANSILYQDQNIMIELPRPNLLGTHQIQNAGIALAALTQLTEKKEAFYGAVSKAKWPARMQKLSTGPILNTLGHSDVWLDGGHNPAAGKALASYLSTQNKKPTVLICGMLKTKDAAGYLSPLSNFVKFLAAVSIPNEQNTLPADETAKKANELGIKSKSFTSISEGVRFIADQFPNCQVLICGSLYLAGQILRENQ